MIRRLIYLLLLFLFPKLCSAQAAYIVGQNILADGGAYPGTF